MSPKRTEPRSLIDYRTPHQDARGVQRIGTCGLALGLAPGQASDKAKAQRAGRALGMHPE